MRSGIVISLLIIGSLLACYFLLPGVQQEVDKAYEVLTSDDRERISQYVSGFGIWGPLFIVVAMILQMFLFVIPSILLITVSILAYGPGWGSVIALSAVLASASVGYLLGKIFGHGAMQKLAGKQATTIEDYVSRYGYWAIVIARISPALSNDAVSIVAGVFNLNYLKFMLASIAGVAPLIGLIAYLGKDSDRLKDGLIWISVIGLVAFVAYVIYDRRKRSKSKEA